MAETTEHRHHGLPPRSNTAVLPSPLSVHNKVTPLDLRRLKRDDDAYSVSTPVMSRRTSVDSDRYSTVSGLTTHFPSNPTNVHPAPAYVAPFGASQVVSEHQASKRRLSSDDEDEDDKQNKDDVEFSESALALVNAFLDQLLYSFLSTARSTSLLALRPAVTEVLKHRLARDAIASAEEELAELLAGGDDEEEMDSKHKAAENGRKWDLELVWKRTRLRVMVYMRLGEMEDDDEQRYVKEEELFHGSERRFSSSTGLVSWAAAIFLTSVLEYVAEQTLQVSGHAASTRARRQSRTQRLTGSTDAQTSDDLVVEEYDVEKVALNSTLGRLWRTWRKALRNTGTPNSPTQRMSSSNSRISRENMASAFSSRRQNSFDTARGGSVADDTRPVSRDQLDDMPETEYPEHVLAANIPLPIGDHSRDVDEIEVSGLGRDPDVQYKDDEIPDVPYTEHELGTHVPVPVGDEKRDIDEIEVPGLARDPDDEGDGSETATPNAHRRRSSFPGYMPYSVTSGLPTPDNSNPNSPGQAERPPMTRLRSMSVPTPTRTPMLKEDKVPSALPEEQEETVQRIEESPNTKDAPQADQQSEDQQLEEMKPEGDDARERATSDASIKRKNEFPWMAAAAAAEGAEALGSKNDVNSSYEDRFLPPGATESTNRQSFGGLIENPGRDDGSKDEREKRKTLLDIKQERSQSSFSDEEIEELDRRKSLLDIKSVMIAGQSSGQQSPQKADSGMLSPNIARTNSDESSSAKDAYELGHSSEGVSEEEGPEDAIGLARTLDSAPPGVLKTPSPNLSAEEQQARESSKRPARLILDDSLPSNSDDTAPATQGETPKTPRQYVGLTSETTAPPPPQEEPQRPASRPSQRANLANGAEQLPAVEKSPHRQSFTAPVQKNSPRRESESSAHNKQSSEQDIQEHPVVQRMVSIKRSDPKSATSEKAMPLTSASIRGPEDFDMFVQGADTVKYTLTPETVRDDPVSECVCGDGDEAYFKQAHNNTLYSRQRQSPVEMDATSVKSVNTRTGRSQASKQATSATSEDDSRPSKRRSISKPPPKNTSTHRKSGLMAREPRVMTESTRDFADFIRSTGPNRDSAIYPILANASYTSLHSLRSAHINGASASRSSSPGAESRTRSLTNKSVADEQYVPPVPPIPGRAKTSMQPRGATSASDGSSELIDFIRSGPDQDGKQRISRTVAPFRSTMDSDQLRDLGERASTDKPVDRSITGAPSVQSLSSARASSLRTSANSRTALLSGSSNAVQTVQPAYSGQPTKLSGGYSRTSVAQEGEPGRKRHRDKDPYSMDFLDDDDEDELLAAMPKTSRKEESLADFLNESEPPKNNGPRPIVTAGSAQAQSAASKARMNSMNGQRSGNVPPRSVSNTTSPKPGYASSVASRQAQINSSVTSAGNSTPRMQARGGAKDIAANSNTKDLADFLKSSGPDEPDSAPAPIVGRGSKMAPKEAERVAKKSDKKKTGSFFSRGVKKKTYLDVP